MNEEFLSRISLTLPAATPDVGGACSILFPLGGLIVVHDAAGCVENYTLYDEPRWFGAETRLYSSNLNQMDAVLGNDERLLRQLEEAAEHTHPAFLAIVGSPVPHTLGMDLEGIAAEAETRTGIPSFGIPVGSFEKYPAGISAALLRAVQRFAEAPSKAGTPTRADRPQPELSGECPRRRETETAQLPPAADALSSLPPDRQSSFSPAALQTNGDVLRGFSPAGPKKQSINLLGATPLDFSDAEYAALRETLLLHGVEIHSELTLGGDLNDIRRCGEADGNLALSSGGLETARWLRQKYGTPYTVGLPIGSQTEVLLSLLRGEVPPPSPQPFGPRALVLGEAVFAESLAGALIAIGYRAEAGSTMGVPPHWKEERSAVCPLRSLETERAVCDALREDWALVIGDPLYRQLLPEGSHTRYIERPHQGLSSKLFPAPQGTIENILKLL